MVSCDILQKYKLKLTELTFNDKFVITNLSALADEYLLYARDIVPIIESHLFRVSPSLKLPVFYLIDCIIKNVGKDYGVLFCNNLVRNFCHVFKQVDDTTRFQLLKLRKTWNGIIPSNVLFVLDAEISQLEQKKNSNFQPRNNRNLMAYQNNSDDGYRNNQNNSKNFTVNLFHQQNVGTDTFGHYNSHSRGPPVVTGAKRHFNDNNDFARNKRIRNENVFRHGPRNDYDNSSNLKFNSVNVRCNNSTVFVNNSNSINHAHRREETYHDRKESNRSRKRKNRKMNGQTESHFENTNKVIFDTSVPPPNYNNYAQSFSNYPSIGNGSVRVPSCSAISQDKRTEPIIDVHALLKQLEANGILPSNISTSYSEGKNNLKVSFEDLRSLKSCRFVQKLWFAGNQCRHCGLRFDFKEKDQYNEHVKNHRVQTFKFNNTTPIITRNWYYNKFDWINNKKIERKENNDDEKREKKIPCAIAEANVAVTKCCVCTDTFDLYFDHDEDEWLLQNAIQKENQFFHPLCYEDDQISKNRRLNEN